MKTGQLAFAGWIQVDFMVPHDIKAVGIQARTYEYIQYLISGSMKISNDSFNWSDVKNGKVNITI